MLDPKTIKTHDNVSVSASNGNTQTNYMDCQGYDKLALTLLNSASTSSKADVIWSHDGITAHGEDKDIIATGTPNRRAGETTVKAKWAKVYIYNGDTVSRNMSAWAYLKPLK